MASGRGLVEEYIGEGYVFTTPTLGYYNNLSNLLTGKAAGTKNVIGSGADAGKKRRSFKELLGFRGTGREKRGKDRE